MDPAFVVPLRSAPSATAPSIGQASAIVLVRSPEVVSNGFVKAVLFNGREGWIAAADIKPWHNPGGSGQRCIPSRMSDGSIGFAPMRRPSVAFGSPGGSSVCRWGSAVPGLLLRCESGQEREVVS